MGYYLVYMVDTLLKKEEFICHNSFRYLISIFPPPMAYTLCHINQLQAFSDFYLPLAYLVHICLSALLNDVSIGSFIHSSIL